MRPPAATLVPAASAASWALVAALALQGCGTDADGPGGPPGPSGEPSAASLQERLGELPGVQGVTAGETQVDQDLSGVRAVVDLEAGVGVEDVTAVLETVAAADPDEVRVYSDVGDSDFRDAPLLEDTSAISADRGLSDPPLTAELFVAAIALAGDDAPAGTLVSVTADGDRDPSVTLVVPGASRAQLDRVRRAVGEDETLAAAGARVAAG